MEFTREDAENLLKEISEKFLGKVEGETLKPSKIRYFDDHQTVEINFSLWRKYANRRKQEVSYMWTVYLRSQKIRYGLAVSCLSADASERALVKLLGEDTVNSLEEKGFSIIRLDRRVMLGKELPLDAFDETQKEESLNLVLNLHSLLGSSIAMYEGSLCPDVENGSVVEALKNMKARYSMEWENEGKPLIEKAREEVIKFAKGESNELNLPSEGDAGRLLWFVAGGVSDRGDPEGIREFLRALMGSSPEDAIELVREYSREIKGTSALGLINLAALVYPEELMPLWGSEKDERGILNPVSSELLGLKKKASELKLEEYKDLLERIKQASREVRASNLFEVAFYLMKMNNDTLVRSYLSNRSEDKAQEEYGQTVYLLSDYLASQGYLYPKHLVAQVYTALKTKGFVILSGLTGTGKTKIVQEIASLLDPSKDNFLFLSLRPDWRDSKPLLGYYNPLNEKYYKTPLLKFILKALAEYQLSHEDLQKRRIWFIKCGEEGDNTKYAKMALQGNYISIGWYKIPDLRTLPDEELGRLKTSKDERGELIDGKGQLKTFFQDISGGDIVVMPLEKLNDKYKVAIGVITSEYYYEENPSDTNPQKHRRKVMWLTEAALEIGNIRWTVQEVREDTTFLQKERVLSAIVNALNPQPHFILLDEMNLAHVEYYFADFLSVLESGRDESGFTRESIKLHDVDEVEEKQGIPKEIRLPPNLYIAGTVNMDETTYSFSPKVLDRAFTVEFHDVNLEEYPPDYEESRLPDEFIEVLRGLMLEDLRGRDNQFLARSKVQINEAVKELKNTKSGKYWQILQDLNHALKTYDFNFGYRVVDEIALFFKNARKSRGKGIVEFESEEEIFDLALLMKVLPKFHGNRKKLEEPLKTVLELCISKNAGINVQELGRNDVIELLKNWETQKKNFRFKHAARKVLRMLRQLYEIGFASFS